MTFISVLAKPVPVQTSSFDNPHRIPFPQKAGALTRVFPSALQSHVESIKQEWESTVDALPQLICLLNDAGAITRSNRTVERWGLGSVAEVAGHSLHDLMHPGCDHADCYLKSFLSNAADSLERGAVTHCQAEDRVLGRVLDIRLHSRPSHGAFAASQQVSFAMAVVTDITDLKAAERSLQAQTRLLDQKVKARTERLDAAIRKLRCEVMERKQAQAALQQSQNQYKQLVETMNEGLVVGDPEGRIRYVNNRFAEMLGCASGAMLGREVRDFVDCSCLQQWENQMALRSKGGHEPYDLAFRGADGSRVSTRVSPSLLFDATGNYIGGFAVITDISDHVKAEQLLRLSQHELRQLSIDVLSAQEKERQRIASELHDSIGQTLSAIKYYMESVVAHSAGKSEQACASPFAHVIPRLQDAIEEVRRISMDLRPSMLDDFGIIATLKWFCREFSMDYQAIRVKPRMDIQESDIPEPLKIVIFRIVQEALNNAAKHARCDTVRVTLFKSARGIALEVSDNGTGFDADEIASRHQLGDTGTGLVNMRERAEATGGKFTLESTKARGTRICAKWPGSHCPA